MTSPTARVTDAVAWHDAECGSYVADLEVWGELAAQHRGDVLELGAGTGRVALSLAAGGARVLAIDTEAELIDELNVRAQARALDARGMVADARDAEPTGHFRLIVAPMQLLQLMPGSEERRRLFAAARARLSPEGALAVAIVEGTPVAAIQDESQDPPVPDVAEHAGWVYSSLPLGVEPRDTDMIIRRLRQRVAPDGTLDEAIDETVLAIVDAEDIAAEAIAAGMRVTDRRDIDPTDDHIGSTVLVMEAG